MKLVCTKENLNRGLGLTSRIIGAGSTLPILNNILFKTSEGRLKLSGTNLEMAINTWVGGKIEEEGEITIPARIVNNLVNNLLSDKIALSTKNNTLFLEGEKTQTHIKGLAADEFPLIPKIEEGKPYAKVDGGVLGQAISEVIFAAAFSETQPEISGILWNFKGKTLTLAATDRYRLAEEQISLEEDVLEEKEIIIPSRAVNELARMIEKGGVEIYLTENQASFKTLDAELITRLIEGKYPDYKQIIPKNFTTEAVVGRPEFIQSIKAASLFSSDNNNIELEIHPQVKQLIIKSQSAQVGDSEIRLDADIIGHKNSIIFNYRYLLECLNNLADEKIVVKVIDSSSPAEILPVGRENYAYIVMPIKI